MLATRMLPAQYRLVVEGELGPRYAAAFEGMSISAHDGITEITGAITDRSHLQGLLERIAGLGLTLHSVVPVEDQDPDAANHNRGYDPMAALTEHLERARHEHPDRGRRRQSPRSGGNRAASDWCS
jgi:hypothetical protein